MDDPIAPRPDHALLYQIASGQRGYFTAAQARSSGFNWDLLTHHARTGRFLRERRGLYRFRDYPSSLREEVMAAWLAVGGDDAVVSHESALELLELSDVVPNAIHLTVPRSKRYLPRLPTVAIHTSTSPPRRDEVVIRDGLPITGATRTILDAADAGTAPEQIEMAVIQALDRALTTARRLREAAATRSARIIDLVERGIEQAEP